MLTAIRFHDQALRDAREIDDEAADPVLTAELALAQVPAAQHPPEQALGICLMAAEIAGLAIWHRARLPRSR